MNALIVTIGSHGDAHPFLGIAQRLKQRGHDVTFFASAIYTDLAAKLGLKFVPLGTEEEFLRIARDPDIWHKTKALKLLGGYVSEQTPRLYKRIVEHLPAEPTQRDQTVLVMSSLAMAARLVQEMHGIAAASVHLAPSLFRTGYDAPRMPGLILPRWLPAWVKNAVFDFGDRKVIDPIFAPRLNEFRATLGLAPVRKVMANWWHSPDCIIGLFPEWFAARQPDWPKRLVMTGFPLYDEADVTPIADEDLRFCEEGTPPIAFTPGSANLHGHQFFKVAVEACELLGMRAVLLSRHAEHIPVDLPPTVRHIPYAPLSALLASCSALVHHGGIGTLAQALRAGVPQVVMPMSYDQLDNADRVERLGVGSQISPRRFTPLRLAKVLSGLLESTTVKARTLSVAARFKTGDDALAQTAIVIEQLIERKIQTVPA